MSNKVFVIAEAGVNHNGSIDLAKKLIDTAANSGADAVKFQTFKAEKLATKIAEQCEYQSLNTNTVESQFEMLKRLEIGKREHEELYSYCQQKDIEFMSTPFDIESIHFLIDLGVKRLKVPSGELTNYPYLSAVGACGKPIILSTGMSDMNEVRSAVEVLESAGTLKEKVTVLHATTDYPTQMSDVNLLAMQTIGTSLSVSVGYSDHTNGIEVPVAAVALGAAVIEKHFTLDRSMPGPDHKASLEPKEMNAMVTAIRNIESALGDGVKAPTQNELSNMNLIRKSIVAQKRIKKGERFDATNISVKRPAGGISPIYWDVTIGRIASRDYIADELIDDI